MLYLWWLAGILLALIWLDRLQDAARGMRTIADISQPQWDCVAQPPSAVQAGPHVTIIVPARNEQENVEAAIGSLLRLDYPNYEIIAVDDRSTDRTGEILDRLAQQNPRAPLRVLHIRELPPGWLGKPHGMWTAAQQAAGEWILFTDADVVFRPDALRRALSYAEQSRADHVVLFPQMIMHSVGERMMVAFFQILFVFGHRPWKVADPHARDHMGIGAFNLVRRHVYDAIGTHQALRLCVLDDMKLGEAVKRGGFAQRNVFGGDLLRLRWVDGAAGMIENLTKNFFALVQFRWPVALGAALALLFFNALPFVGVGLAPGWSRIGYGFAVLGITAMYLGMSQRSPISPLYVFLHPLGALLFAYTMLRSTALTLWRNGVDWRGTRYSLEELRKGRV